MKEFIIKSGREGQIAIEHEEQEPFSQHASIGRKRWKERESLF